MSIAAKLGAFSAALVVAAMGLAACQTSGTVTSIATEEPETTLTSWLAKPQGEGPFPAVVLMHGCSGTERHTTHKTVWRGLNRHAVLLNDYGYVTLIVDSFGPRGIADGCQTGGEYYPVQVGDARAAHDHLASLPYVDGERIGFVGPSPEGGDALQRLTRAPYYVEGMDGTYYAEAMDGRILSVARNPTARRESQERMLTFLAKHLGGPYPAKASEGVDAAGNSGFGDFLRAAFALND